MGKAGQGGGIGNGPGADQLVAADGQGHALCHAGNAALGLGRRLERLERLGAEANRPPEDERHFPGLAVDADAFDQKP